MATSFNLGQEMLMEGEGLENVDGGSRGFTEGSILTATEYYHVHKFQFGAENTKVHESSVDVLDSDEELTSVLIKN